MKKTVLIGCAAFMAMATGSYAQSGYKLSNKISLPGDGKWDYSKVDEKSNRLFVSHFDCVHAVDLTKESATRTIKNLHGVHGIALAPAFNEGFISNGKDNTVSVFNYKTLDSITTIKLATEKPDAIMYDEYSKKVWVICGASNNAAVIDPATNKVVMTVAVGKGPEFAVSNNKGLIYDNLEDANGIAVIDANAGKLVKTFPLEGKAAPTGLAIDIANNRLFSACAETKVLAVLDATTGKIIASLPISNKVDAVSFDEGSKLIFCPGGDGITTVIRQVSKDKYEVLESLKTLPGAKTMALDNRTHKIYLSTAEYEAGTKNIKPNTFGVLVYSK